MLNRKLAISAALAMVAGLGIASSSWAGQATSDITVSTNVIQKCTISAPATFIFTDYDPFSGSADTQTGTINVTCSRGSTGVNVGITLGSNPGAASTYGARAMKNGTSNYLGYDIFQPSAAGSGGTCGGTTSWDTTATVLGSGTFGVSAPLAFNMCGSIAPGQDVVQGAYSDIVQAQVNF